MDLMGINNMKQICLDTETTGFNPATGDRMVEIACIEIENYRPTGKEFHFYLNPERDVPDAAFQVHGLSTDFLKDKPLFSQIVDDFLAFIADYPLVIHNAKFDMKFINHELSLVKKKPIPFSRTIDTLDIARKKFPGSPATLDALCKRFKISLENRTLHGALIDTYLLAEMYLHLCGEGYSPSLTLDVSQNAEKAGFELPNPLITKRETPHKPAINDAEKQQHQEFISTFKMASLWDK